MINVKVSATSANLGAGFDCMGLALNLYNEVLGEKSDRIEITTDGGYPTDDTNLVYRSAKSVFDLLGKPLTGLKMVQTNRIPPASGLGSSAACVVAGVKLGNALMGFPLTEKDEVNLCAKLDGHPDNVVPAITGGVSAGVMTQSGVEYIRCSAPDNLVFATATPNFELHTEFSRSVLPKQYSREDAVFSLSRAVVTFGAFVSGQSDMLKVIDDRLHQPYRIPLIDGYTEITDAFCKAGCISHFISGAGPTLIGLFHSEPKGLKLKKGWTLRYLHVVNHGAQVTVC